MLLGSDAIRSSLENGEIVCNPMPTTIEATHIDLHLGEYYYTLTNGAGRYVVNLNSADPDEEYTLFQGNVYIPEHAILQRSYNGFPHRPVIASLFCFGY